MIVGRHVASTVLVVDDSPIVLEMTRAVLEGAGYRVITRSRGSGTVEAVLQERPDLVLLDVKMPRFNGDTIARILTKSERERRTIVLLYSSCSAAVLAQKVLETGADGYIQKTSQGSDLVTQVNRWLRTGMSSSQCTPAQRAKDAAASQSEALPVLNRSQSGRRLRLPSVLFADTDAFALAAYRKAERSGELIGEFVESGERALRYILSREAPDVVVCDPAMIGSDGSTIFERAVRHDASWRRRFVFVTGPSTMGHLTRLLASVSDQVLYRPVDQPALLRAVRFASIAARVFSAEPSSEATASAAGELVSVRKNRES